mmetsp:Transcript_117697/g.340284  ORF Transcript_117697/g.340284 Transcript_117697/m.340284 type:complete len:366 (-) Transcript_117697:1837-2934(-)
MIEVPGPEGEVEPGCARVGANIIHPAEFRGNPHLKRELRAKVHEAPLRPRLPQVEVLQKRPSVLRVLPRKQRRRGRHMQAKGHPHIGALTVGDLGIVEHLQPPSCRQLQVPHRQGKNLIIRCGASGGPAITHILETATRAVPEGAGQLGVHPERRLQDDDPGLPILQEQDRQLLLSHAAPQVDVVKSERPPVPHHVVSDLCLDLRGRQPVDTHQCDAHFHRVGAPTQKRILRAEAGASAGTGPRGRRVTAQRVRLAPIDGATVVGAVPGAVAHLLSPLRLVEVVAKSHPAGGEEFLHPGALHLVVVVGEELRRSGDEGEAGHGGADAGGGHREGRQQHAPTASAQNLRPSGERLRFASRACVWHL